MAKYDGKSDRLASFLLKKVNKAVYEYGMIRDGDRVGIALSGGKDSFSLLRVLDYRRRFVAEDYTLVALHVIGDARGPEMPPYPELEAWLEQAGVEYLVRPTHVAADESLPMNCQRCTWNRRRTLFEMAGDADCGVIAFGHHLDDLAETAMMNLARHGRLETMEPVRSYFDGKMRIIRPLMYVPEFELKRFASVHDFPSPPPECPLGQHTERRRMKDILAGMHTHTRQTKNNIVKAALLNTKRTVENQ